MRRWWLAVAGLALAPAPARANGAFPDALAILLPRWRYAFYAAVSLVAAERVLENAHYVSDAVAGAGLGVFSAYATWHALRNVWAPEPKDDR